jgi:hypothetical protein
MTLVITIVTMVINIDNNIGDNDDKLTYVKLPLCLTKQQVMRMYGKVGVQLHTF